MTQADDNAGAAADDNHEEAPAAGDVRDSKVMSLEAAHAQAMATIENDDEVIEGAQDEDEAGKAAAEAEAEKQAAAAKKDDDDADNAGAEKGGGGTEDDGDDEAAPAASGGDSAEDDTARYQPGAAGIPKADELQAPEAPSLDADISKPGKYKVEFTDADGNKYYVSSVAQLPEDFEPRNYREYGVSIENLATEKAKFAEDERGYTQAKTEYENKAQVRALEESWQADIDRMTTEKVLPEKKEDREKVVAGVYKLMGDEMAKGNIIDRFSQAHEIYEAREAKRLTAEAAAAKDAAEKADRKKRGGKVMGGGGARSSAGGGRSGGDNRGRVLDGVRPGTGLDAVHAHVSNGY